MTRIRADKNIDTRSARRRLSAQKEPHWTRLAPGQSLGYYRPAEGGAGSWWARLYHPDTRKYAKTSLGTADDFQDGDDRTVFTFAQAQARAHLWFRETRAKHTGEAIHTGPFTVEDAWNAYIAKYKRSGGKAAGRMESVARAHILPALGRIEVSKLTRGKVEHWLDALNIAPARVRSGMGRAANHRPLPEDAEAKRARRASANRVLTVLKAMLNHAKDRRLTQASGEAWREVKPNRGTASSRTRFLTPEEAQRLVNACPPDLRNLVKGALFTGARFGELVRMQAQDFNPSGAKGAGTVHITESKSGKPRHVVLTGEGRGFFEEILVAKTSADLLFVRDSVARRKRPGANAWMASDHQRMLRSACAAAGIQPLCFHELRHTYASGLVNKGVPLAYVAAQLGHSDTRMVEKHYGHLAPSALAEAILNLAPTLGIHTPTNVAAIQVKLG